MLLYSNSYLDKDKIKESLTSEDINTILLDLGSGEPQYDNQNRPKFTTVCHPSGDGYNLQYYPENHSFYCYSQCRERKDIFQIVIDAKAAQGYELSFYESVQYVANLTGKSFTTSLIGRQSSDIVNDWDWINRITRKKPIFNKELPSFNENVLDVFLPYTNDWISEDISKRIAGKYEVGYYLKNDSITIPHRDESGRLVGIRQRNTRKEDLSLGRKYVPTIVGGTQYNHILSQNLYGLHITKEAIKRHKRVYIFEGEKSTMRCHSYYGEDNFSVSVCGSNISNWQVEKILSLGVDHVIIAFDKFRKRKEDESEELYEKMLRTYQNRLLNLAHKFTPFVRTYIIYDFDELIDYGEAPIDKGKETFEILTNKKMEITTKGE